MNTIKQRDRSAVWHPYTPMKAWPEAIGIVRGEGAYLIDEDGKHYLDAISSWWVNLHGHSNAHIAERVSMQLHTLEHCIFAGFTHEPAVELAERLLPILPGAMSKIFYSDNGSTAVEVAIKMSLQYWHNKGLKKQKLVALEGAYHGDTFGAMAVSGRSIFTETFADLLFDVTFIPFPEEGKEAESIAALKHCLVDGGVAAMIVEPLIQGTAGMRMYTPDVLQQYYQLCHRYEALVIADEVMTGFGRTGPLFASSHVNEGPDMVCLSKGLTGGTMPMGITACTQQIFDAFYDDDRSKMLYHGHSFTANPVSCAAALASLDLLLTDECNNDRLRIQQSHQVFSATLRQHRNVSGVRIMGTIIAFDVKDEDPSYHSSLRDRMYRHFLEQGILLRPLGTILYILPPYCITDQQLQHVYTAILAFLESL